MMGKGAVSWLALASAAIPAVAWADNVTATGNGDIVVTATRREARIQTVPISITALDERALERRGTVQIEDYARLAPGLVYGSNGANGGTFSIRGITTSTLAGNTQSPVALYYDDLPALNSFIPLVTPDMRLFDVARVEVLRGPQGTLFGSGALGGAIRVISNKPDPSRVAARFDATLADTRSGGMSYGADAMLNVPLAADKAAVRIVGNWRRDGGWVDNPVTGRKDVNRQIAWGGRIMLALKPTETVDILAQIRHQDDDPDDSSYSLYADDPRTNNARTAQATRQRLTIYNVTGTLDLGTAGLTSITTYGRQRQAVTRDFSPVTATLGLTAPGPYNAVGPSRVFAQETRLASTGEGSFSWLAGAFYIRNKRTLTERLTIPGAGVVLGPIGFPSDDLFVGISHISTREAALFGELSWRPVDRLTITGGLRAFWNRIHVANTGTGIFAGGFLSNDRTSKESAVTPRFAIQYQVEPDVMLYAQAAKGYRIGQLNLGPAVDPSTGQAVPTSYGPDSLWNYEAGVKSQFWDRKVTINLAGYYIDWKDIQLQDSTPSGFAFINNAGKARSYGLELEARIAPTDGLSLGTAVSVNASKLRSINPGVNALVGDRLPAAPRFTIASFAEYRAPVGDGTTAYARIDHQYRGKAYGTLNNPTAPVFGDFHVVNLRAGVEFDRYELVLFVNNLADGDGKENAVVLPGGFSAVRLRPRTIGATVRAQF